KQDSSVNKVTLSEIIMEGPDSIAVLQYQLQNADQSGRTLSFSGTGKFNISLGKWISYTGFLAQKKTGMLPMTQVQRIKLSEISVEKYKAILKQAQKMDIFDAGNDFDTQENTDANTEMDNEVDNSDKTVSDADCPTIFRIQILATQNPVKDKSAQFKGLKYNVDELVLSADEKFKYKYTVGAECSHESAKALLEEIKKAGYPQAYIIKTPSK
ncbi:MAG: SPOR domain-containing protein, partial [Bacteroidales bacterium]|nr:SPOR domain-containing protein [Bacteroidales bacterium]